MKRLVILLLLAACSPEPPPPPSDPVVVYAAFEDESGLDEIFSEYKEETGVLVIVRRGPAGKIVDDVIENDISPPADVLITRSVVDVWRAAEESALRPISAESMSRQVPQWAMDPDMLWYALAADHAVIAYRGNTPVATDLPDLADEQFHGQLCLSTSAQPLNRAAIANLIDQLGVRSAEIVVRGWIKNLALPPFATDEVLLGAIADGRCAIGIAAHSAAVHSDASFLQPATLYADIEAIGVARHARNPEGAVALVEWLVAEFADVQVSGDHNLGRRNVSVLAVHDEEAKKLAERARYP